jgi:hypothetical protein
VLGRLGGAVVIADGVDYSFARPSPAGLYAAGKRFAGRYVGPGSGKLLEPAERDALFAAGLDIFLLAEGNADSAAGGYSVGVSHAQQALAASRALGAPESTAIYFAVDYDVSSKGWDAPREYLRGAGSVIGPARVGVYGEYDVMGWAARDGVAAWFFQTYAWSAGRWYAGNHVEQYLNGQIVAGGEVDLCRSMLAEFGQWRAKPAAQEGDNMFMGQIPPGAEAVTIVPTPWTKSQISFGADFGKAKLRVARHVVNRGWIDIQEVVVSSGDLARVDLPARDNVDRTSVRRVKLDDADDMTTPVAFMAWWA